MNGPSPYAVRVIRSLLKKPQRIPELASSTRLHPRTVQAQISSLLDSKAVYVAKREQVRWGGRWAVYAVRVEDI